MSRLHTRIYYQGHRWMLRDMGSRNGTHVNGNRVHPGSAICLKSTDRILFGDVDEDWRFCDSSPPLSMLIPMNRASSPIALGDILALPNERAPCLTVFSNGDNTFFLEDENGATTPLEHGQTVEINGAQYQVHIDSASENAVPDTRTEDRSLEAEGIGQIHLSIRVAPDEESAAVALTADGAEYVLPPRAHLYLLAYLARTRIAQTPSEPPSSGQRPSDACGWVDTRSACKDLLVNPEHLAQMVFRIRKDMKSLDTAVAMQIIDRQIRGKMRIGFVASCLSVELLR